MTNRKDYTDNCESCVTKPCQIGCPLNNDITGFIRCLKKGEDEQAFHVLANTTVLMPLCGRICPHLQQCEGKCVKGVSYDRVQIGQLETLVGDEALENDWEISAPETTKYKVAVIGGGPAGLTCAAFLRRNGIGVKIYEKHDYLGGLLVHGIPEFRLPKTIVQKVVEKILGLGIEVEYGKELGRNLSLEELKSTYDAIFIGIGANNSNKMEIPGENLEGVYGGNEILEYKTPIDYQGKTVIVSGGGNVAMDVSRTAKKSGAQRVIVVYRRSEKEMPAEKKEIAEAKEEGIEFLFLTSIIGIEGNGKVEQIEVLDNELVQKEGDSRLSPVPIEGSNHKIPCDYVMMAIGSHADDFVKDLPLKTEKGRIAITKSGRTSSAKIFSGGDIAGAKGTVAWASRSGRNAAYEIIKYLEEEII